MPRSPPNRSNPVQTYFRSLFLGLAATAIVSLAIAAIGITMVAKAHGAPFAEIWPIHADLALLIAVPFFLFSVFNMHQRSVWIIAIVLSTLIWLQLYFKPAMAIGGGANIGFGIIAPFVPTGIFCASLLGLLPDAAKSD